ncbi:MAG: phospholipase D-like domain-containing protein [Methanoregula sp.]|nr:phospholipase D-like domain-containing protein [Methanoregula sp.]
MGIYHGKKDGLKLTAYTGDRAVLLAFDLDKEHIDRLAGFAIAATLPDTERKKGSDYFLKNRLNFNKPVTAKKPFGAEQWTASDSAPFQTFHWTHYPSTGPGRYIYTLFAMYFETGTTVLPGPSVSVEVDLVPEHKGNLDIGFTRTMVSSQAYVNRFKNADLYPEPQTIDYDTTPFQVQYAWLGAHAREMLVAFLEKCRTDPDVTVDVFAFDLDEADTIRTLCSMGSRVRVYQDNSGDHTSEDSEEPDMKCLPKPEKRRVAVHEPMAVHALRQAGVQVKTGHFSGLSHNKVIIRRRNNLPEAILTGSANFTIRGLYVQANSILVFEDKSVADLYAQAFDQAWNDPRKFKASKIALGWYDRSVGKSRFSFSFAPHTTAFPLDRIADAVRDANQSVLFAMMRMRSSGKSIDAITGLPEREDLYSMGILQKKGELELFKPDVGKPNFTVASTAHLAKDVPYPFSKEIGGGSGQVIHHKFVVCDFNSDNPVVFCGSSNLAASGETSNSDNLIAIYDRDIAVRYAVEAVRLYDHFRFRSLREGSTSAQPLQLKTSSDWAKTYYDPGSIRYRERIALVGG